jgi:hypothetical protein
MSSYGIVKTAIEHYIGLYSRDGDRVICLPFW